MYKSSAPQCFSFEGKMARKKRGAALIKAAKKGDESRLEQLRKNGADVNFQDQILGTDSFVTLPGRLSKRDS